MSYYIVYSATGGLLAKLAFRSSVHDYMSTNAGSTYKEFSTRY